MKKNFMQWLFLAAVIIFSAGCSKSHHLSSNTFVLVHGSWQAPYVWNNVKAELEKAGQEVIVVELPAHGNDFTSPAAVSIDVYRDKVISAINNTNSKVILVGHSLGGMVVSAVAEKTPSKIKKLIYIAGFVPVSGQSLLELANQDAQSLLGPALILSKDQLLLEIKPDAITSIFCQDGSNAVKKLVLDNYRAEPAIPFTNPVTVTDANFGSVDKYYIHTLQDHAIGTDLQNRMANAAHISKTFSLNTGHSPFLTQPDEVTKLLLQIAN